VAQFDCPVLLDVNDISLKYIVSGLVFTLKQNIL